MFYGTSVGMFRPYLHTALVKPDSNGPLLIITEREANTDFMW